MTGERGAPPAGRPATLARPDRDSAQRDPEQAWAVLGYVGAIFLWALPPLAVYLVKRNALGDVRWHAAQSLNVVITAALFAVCCAIIAGLLALDTPVAGLAVLITLLSALWLAMACYLVRAAAAARHGDRYEVPGWLCVPMVR
jgi:uncharacterized Tic20 family protein